MTSGPGMRRRVSGAESALTSLCPALRTALALAGYDADTLLEVLGPAAHAALGRGEPVPVRRAVAGAGDLATLVQLFLLGDVMPTAAVRKALHPVDIAAACAAGLLAPHGGDGIRAVLDVRPLDLGYGTRWVISDPDDSMRRRTLDTDHVLGVGQASLSLLRGTPAEPVGSVLDLGTGCGVQAIHAASYANHVTATDVSPRALRLAAATAELNGASLDLRAGSWLEPVAGEQFGQVVANPPFVVGPARVEHTYRDSGLALDGASKLVLSQVPAVLAPGGTAALLASWIHRPDEDWRARVASWLPDTGIDAWVVQRDVADPALYVGTWLRDSGCDPRDEPGQARAAQWLDALAEANVAGIGFGFVYLRSITGPTEVLAEDLTHGFSDPLGAEVPSYFARSAWLRHHDVAAGRFQLDPATALERVSLPGPSGWAEQVTRVHRGGGPAWTHEVDELAVALLAGLHTAGGALTLREIAGLLSAGYLGGHAGDVLLGHAVTLVTALVRHGLLTPVTGAVLSATSQD